MKKGPRGRNDPRNTDDNTLMQRQSKTSRTRNTADCCHGLRPRTMHGTTMACQTSIAATKNLSLGNHECTVTNNSLIHKQPYPSAVGHSHHHYSYRTAAYKRNIFNSSDANTTGTKRNQPKSPSPCTRTIIMVCFSIHEIFIIDDRLSRCLEPAARSHSRACRWSSRPLQWWSGRASSACASCELDGAPGELLGCDLKPLWTQSPDTNKPEENRR